MKSCVKRGLGMEEGRAQGERNAFSIKKIMWGSPEVFRKQLHANKPQNAMTGVDMSQLLDVVYLITPTAGGSLLWWHQWWFRGVSHAVTETLGIPHPPPWARQNCIMGNVTQCISPPMWNEARPVVSAQARQEPSWEWNAAAGFAF